ncbi:MAG: hypothetical protein K2Q24_17095 [Chitinophagaceae bacterium]|nr:hypothetical protein [Chitinophagaceae bacterium]
MNKIILAVILLAALGGALYYYLQQNKTPDTSSTAFQQKIVGEWKIDSVAATGSVSTAGLLAMALDTNFSKYHFQFKEDGSITQLLGDSIVPVKRSYEWKDSARLVFKEGETLSEIQPLQVLSFSKEQFSIMSTDSSVFYFKKQNR